MKVITKTNFSYVAVITESLQVTFPVATLQVTYDLIDVVMVIGPIFILKIMKMKMKMHN